MVFSKILLTGESSLTMLRMLCAKSMQPGAMWLVALSSYATVPDLALNIEVLLSFEEIYVNLAGYCKWSDFWPAIGQARRSALPPKLHHSPGHHPRKNCNPGTRFASPVSILMRNRE